LPKVEDSLLGLPDVADCAVWEEHAFIALKKSQAYTPEMLSSWDEHMFIEMNRIEMNELAGRIQASLASGADGAFQVPSVYHFIDSVPRNARDKIDRGALRGMAASAAGTSQGDWGVTIDLRSAK
jgi:acyl-coenzyme A synthetase/AMP-(fatty) acid ligase